MTRTVLLCGALLAILVIMLRVLEYRYFVRELSTEIYVGVVAILFTALGVWVGLSIMNRQRGKPPDAGNAALDPDKLKSRGISERELDVLRLMQSGCSNQEIADKLFVSLQTIKTHCSNLYGKLGVRRRTQAVQKAREISAAP